MPGKQHDRAGYSGDETEGSGGEPHAHVLPKLAGRTKIAELRMKLVSGRTEPLVHCHCRLLEPNLLRLAVNENYPLVQLL
jgi:hypothetical protein